MSSRSPTVEKILIQLAETPVRLAAVTFGLTSTQLQSTPGPDEWSATDVLAHLRACVDVWGGHIVAIIAEERPTRQGVNPRTWIKQTDYLELKFRPSLRSFNRQRADLLAVLEPLPRDGWSRTATVMAWGVAHERTLMSFAEHLVRHERTHLKQIARIVETVGGGR